MLRLFTVCCPPDVCLDVISWTVHGSSRRAARIPILTTHTTSSSSPDHLTQGYQQFHHHFAESTSSTWPGSLHGGYSHVLIILKVLHATVGSSPGANDVTIQRRLPYPDGTRCTHSPSPRAAYTCTRVKSTHSIFHWLSFLFISLLPFKNTRWPGLTRSAATHHRLDRKRYHSAQCSLSAC